MHQEAWSWLQCCPQGPHAQDSSHRGLSQREAPMWILFMQNSSFLKTSKVPRTLHTCRVYGYQNHMDITIEGILLNNILNLIPLLFKKAPWFILF
jgi:hypothetical protein